TMRNPLFMSPFIPPPRSESKLANDLKHEGIRVGEIIAYRAWRVVESAWMRRTWMRQCDNRLHSVIIKDYVWLPDQPASGDVREHGIYSFKNVIRSSSLLKNPSPSRVCRDSVFVSRIGGGWHAGRICGSERAVFVYRARGAGADEPSA